MKSYDTYLFDADGTLLDTTDLICDCFQFVAKKYTGMTVPREVILAGIGSPLRQQLTTHLGGNLDVDAMLEDYLQFQLKAIDSGLSLFPGVQETLEALKERGKKLGIVTSRRRYSLEIFLQYTSIHDYFEVLITPEDTNRHKPEPEPAIEAMKRFGASPSSTVFIGDAHYDICCGNSAGIDTIFVNWSHTDPSRLPIAPTWTIDTMSELTDPIDSQPF